MDINGKRILITGGGSGIGLAMAQSAQLKLMSRLAPGLLFQQMNKNI